MKLKNILLASLACCIALLLSACAPSNQARNTDQWEQYLARKTITIGFDNTFVPMGFKDVNGINVGFDIDLANAVFAEYGITVNWQPINWNMKETELNNGTIDLIWNGYSITDERKEKVLFSDVYMKTEEVLIVKADSGITSIADMKDKRLGAQSASSGYDAFISNPDVLQKIVKGQDATQYSTFTQAFIDLENDRLDAVISDKVYANYYLSLKSESDNYHVISANLDSGDFAVGARKADKTLVQKINQAFRTLYQKGIFQEISMKWFGEDTAPDSIKN